VSISGGYPADGELIGPYRIVRRIGGGGMGVVFEAHDQALNRQVALKVIAPHLAQNDDFRARFTREAQALASLDSAHVVHVYAHGQESGRLYIATQLVPDGDLERMIGEYGAPPVRVALELMVQVAGGLADAHAAGLIHRDIKPANVLLRRRDSGTQAYLSDFGIARVLGADHTSSTATIGTPSYMAPELHTGGEAGIASDGYSLGCLLWATLNGRAPYGGTSEYQIVSAHLEQPVPQLAGTGQLVSEVNRILRTAMAKDPADRYGSAAQLRDDLRRARTLPDTGASVAASSSRRPLAVLLVVVLLLVLLGGGIAYAVTRGGDADPVMDDTTSPTPTPSPSPAETSDGDLATATASLAQALEQQGAMTGAQAQCTAERWIDGRRLLRRRLELRRPGQVRDDPGDRGRRHLGRPRLRHGLTVRAPSRRTSPRAGRRSAPSGRRRDPGSRPTPRCG